MKRSILLKVFGGYLLIIIILTALFFVLSSHLIKNFYLDTLSRNLEHIGSSLKLKIIPFLDEERFEEMDAFVKTFGKDINTRITVIDRDGKVLADSEEDPAVMENHRSRPEISTAFRARVGQSLRYSTTFKKEMLYVSLPVDRNGKISHVLRVSLFVEDINKLLSRLRADIGRVILIIILVSLLGALVFSRTLTRPIKELSDASQRVASGDFNTKVFLKNRDELRELAEGFNFMTERMKYLFAELSRQKEELNGILSSMEEGLLVLDQNGKILFCNDSFRKLTQTSLVEEKFYWEVLRESEFDDLVKAVLEKKRSHAREIAFNQRILLCSAALLETGDEVVITFHDITEIKRVEKIKKDFIMNVSHELRTPLTAIKGFVETLEEEVDDKCLDYVEIIKRHTDRLINIVKDLLLLSEVEEKEMKLEAEDVNLKKLVENILRIFEQKTKEKGLKMEFSAEDDIPIIKGDSFKLEQMLINIVDNAVKYTEKGTISISLKKADGKVSVEVEDTGIGIPEEQQPRVFERFYVIDKSRSRRLGGTGLGLSIVKHIVLMHNGEVKVKSIPGEGTKFTVFLPA